MSEYSYCVLGAGLMGQAIASDLLLQEDTKNVLITDKDTNQLEKAKEKLNNSKLTTKIIDINSPNQTEEIFTDTDAAIGAISYSYNLQLTQIAIKTKTHFCDLGGNSSVVDEQLKLSQEAEQAGISIIPDCGLAPGLVSVLVKWGLEKYSWIDTVKIRVGGLPANPTNILKYEKLFSIDGLINEYIEPVRILRNKEIRFIEPLSEIEYLQFPKPFGELEAFTTSGGASTLIETYKTRLKNLDYKTIRYKGHCEELKNLKEKGIFTHEYFEKNLPLCTDDITLVKIIFEEDSKKHELEIIDKAKPPFTAMMRTTAFPVAIISAMQARGQIIKMGVMPQERCISTELFINELLKREISIKEI